MNSEITLDVRQLPPWERHDRIFQTFDTLEPGRTLVIINDHNPKPLHYQLMHEREGKFQWESHEESPGKWVATINKLAVPAGKGS